jgi:phosphoribosylamine--glycine ligase
MKIFVIGGGGREHALVWKISQSRRVTQIFCAPGNAGIADLAECGAPADLVEFAIEKQIDFTVVGPEAPLCGGIVDAFQAKGLKIFGPSRQAAQLEGSKAFCKRFLLQHGIPTAAAGMFDDPVAARDYVRKRGAPIVVKADGLAAGKGVVVAETVAEAERAILDVWRFGNRVVIEECLRGEEVSVMALVDGTRFRLLPAAQDYKRVGDGDTGPNTGGMGAYSPVKFAVDAAGIFQRTLAGLKAEGIEYRGLLYAGLMLTAAGPKVLEFNCRFGDPETQVVVPRLDSDLLDALLAASDGRLDGVELKWKAEAAVCVVMASRGYPGNYERGKAIAGLKEASSLANVCVFHAGTKRSASGEIVTDGGRVLGVTALGAGVAEARRRAYEAIGRIRFDGAQYRRDIADRALRKPGPFGIGRKG